MDDGFDIYSKVLPYRAFLIPETDSGKGYMVLMESHAFGDGMQFMAAILQMSNFKDLRGKNAVFAKPPLY
jgi:hypothetical protein